MSDTVPHLDLGVSPDGQPVVILGQEGGQARDMATLLRLAPGIALPAHARDAALLVNHLAHGTEYEVILDPDGFRKQYEAKLAAEAPGVPFQQNVSQLRNFGLPDYAQIKAPRFDGSRLEFYVWDRALGVPYRVTAADLSAAPVYRPVAMTPLPPAPIPPGAGPRENGPTPLTPEERQQRQSAVPRTITR